MTHCTRDHVTVFSWAEPVLRIRITLGAIRIRLFTFDEDPNPYSDATFHFDADPDATFHCDADPDPAPRQFDLSGLKTLPVLTSQDHSVSLLGSIVILLGSFVSLHGSWMSLNVSVASVHSFSL